MTFKNRRADQTRGVSRRDVHRESTTRDVSLATAAITPFRLLGSIAVVLWRADVGLPLLGEIAGRRSPSELESDISRGG